MSSNDYDTKVVEFLMQPENLRASLEVVDHVLEVKRLLVLKFWRIIGEKIQNAVAQYPNWAIQVNSDDKLFRATGEPGIVILPRHPKSDPGYLAFKLGTDTTGTFYGIQCNGKRLPDLRSMVVNLPEFQKTKEQFESFPSDNWGYYWLIGRYTSEVTNRKGLSENENIIRLSQGDSLAETVSTILLEMFQSNVVAVESINNALAKLGDT